MSEITKLYENAGIKPINIAEYGSTYIPKKIEINGKPYPPFTAEKQLELIKWFAIKGNFDNSFDIAKNTFNFWTMYFKFVRFTGEGFCETLAGVFNLYWQDLTEEERKQIKEILE